MTSKEEQQLKKDKKKALLRGNVEEAADICNQLGNVKFQQLDYEGALEEHREELQLSNRLGKLESIAIAHRRVGEALAKLGRYQEALNYHEQYKELAEQYGNPIEIQRAWATVGWTNFNFYSAIADEEIDEPSMNTDRILNQAKLAFFNSLDCAEKLKNDITGKEYYEMKARLLLNIALIYDQRNQMHECSMSLRKAIHLCKNNNLTEDLHRCQYSLACIYFSHGEVDPANSAIDQAMNSAKALKNVSYMTDALVLKSKLQISKKDFESGKRYAKKAYKRCLLASRESIGNFLRNVIGLFHLSEKIAKTKNSDKQCDLHEQIADVFALVNCFQLSIENYKSALNLALELKKPKTKIASIYFSLAQTYADAHDYSNAIENWQTEITFNKGNPKEICSSLLEIAKTQEKQGCDESVVHSTFHNALEIAKTSENLFLEYSCLEKLLNYDKRQGMNKDSQYAIRFKELDKLLQGIDDETEEIASGNTVDSLLQNISLSEISDFSDSDDDVSEIPVKGQRRKKALNIRKNEKGETPLHRACISGKLKQVKNLIKQGHPVNPRDFSGWLPIHEASNYGFKDVVEYLIENGALVNDSGGDYCDGITPLHDAAIGGHLHVMKLLISKGASVHAKTKSGNTPLDCLLEWKKQMAGELDDDIINGCTELESFMRSHMPEAHTCSKISSSVKKQASNCGWVTENTQETSNYRVETITYSIGSDGDDDDDDNDNDNDDYTNPLLSVDDLVNDWEDPDVARNEYQTAITSLRTKPLRVIEKRPDEDLDNPLHTSDNWLVNDITETPKVGTKKRKRTLEDFNYVKRPFCTRSSIPASETSSLVSQENSLLESGESSSKLEFRSVSVHILEDMFAVSVPSSSFTFGCLAEKAADSYYNLHGRKPKLTILRKDGAVLSRSDSISFFQDSVVYAQVDFWDGIPLSERFKRACSSLYIPISKEVELDVNKVEERGYVEVTVGSLLGSPYLSLLLKAVMFQETLKSISIVELRFDKDVLDVFCKCIPTLSNLNYLSLRCCCLNYAKLLQITKAFSENMNSSVCKYQLQQLDLSFNSFRKKCASTFKTLFSCFPFLMNVNLAFCDLSPDLFQDSDFVPVFANLRVLSEFKISGNILSKDSLKNYLQFMANKEFLNLDLSNTFLESDLGPLLAECFLPFATSLQKLVLQECNLKDLDMKFIAEFIGHSSYLKELDISNNPGVTWIGLNHVITPKGLNLPHLTLIFQGCTLQDDGSSVTCLKSISTSRLKKLILSKNMLSSFEIRDKLQKEWQLLWGQRSSIVTDSFDTVIFSVKCEQL